MTTTLGHEHSFEYAVDVVRGRQLATSGAGRKLREQAGLSLAEVATACGVYPSTVLRWETGARVPRDRHAIAYKELLERLHEARGKSKAAP
jgi:DNA-binding transcriptional regulator YiaG